MTGPPFFTTWTAAADRRLPKGITAVPLPVSGRAPASARHDGRGDTNWRIFGNLS
jgi:hypothetical protein